MSDKTDRNYEILVEMRNHTANMEKIMDKLHDNIKAVNDQNVMHHSSIESNLSIIKELVLFLTKRILWLVAFLIMVVLLALGYNEITKFIPFLGA